MPGHNRQREEQLIFHQLDQGLLGIRNQQRFKLLWQQRRLSKNGFENLKKAQGNEQVRWNFS